MAPQLTLYGKQRILHYHAQGIRGYTITKLLRAKDKILISRKAVWRFLKVYRETGSLLRNRGSGRPTKVTIDVLAIVDERMKEDDETTAKHLHALLNERGHQMSMSTIIRCRKELGWTFRGSAYCQMIRDANKVKRKEWAMLYLDEALAENCFQNVVWTDESSICLEAHKKRCYRQKGCPPRRKPK